MVDANMTDAGGNRTNVVLIGMPGVGKSTVGVVLAKRLGYRFIDSDLVIQEQENRLLSDIIEKEGIDGFLAIEDRVNSQIDAHRSVIATGGSAVYGENAMRHLKEIGTIVYLRQSLANVQKRVGDLTGRGVAFREGQTLEDLYEERCPLYEKYAQITVDEGELGISETAVEIERLLRSAV